MRFMAMHKHDKSTENSAPIDPAFVAAMGSFVGEYLQKGVFKDGAGLGKSATRTRLTFRGGEPTILPGPFTGSDNELVAVCRKLTVASRDQAIAWATELGKALGNADLEVGKTTEAWDLGLAPEPPNAPYNCLLLQKASRDFEAGIAPSAQVRAAVEKVDEKMRAAGALTGTLILTPSSRGKRIRMNRNGERNVVDGPFSESKELIGGFALLELPSMADALDLVWKYGELMLRSADALEMDIRPVE